MRKFSCVFTDRQAQYNVVPHTLTFLPSRWSKMALGGMDQATIAVQGPLDTLWECLRLLGDRVTILNENNTSVWWGYVHEVEISLGGTSMLLSLENVYNRMAATYVDARPDGSNESKTTAWIQDDDSIAAFGVKEQLLSVEGDQAAAELRRNSELSKTRWPVPVVRVTGDLAVGAQLSCLGPWHRLAWQYYANADGLVESPDDGPGSVTIGASYTATTISFTPADDIYDSVGATSGLLDLAIGQQFYVAGAGVSANNGRFTVKSSEMDGANAHIETSPSGRLDEAAGNTIVISIGGSKVNRIAQSFVVSVTDGWTVAKISVKAGKVGSPSDTLLCELCADSAGSPGAVLDSASLASSAIPTNSDWVEFTLANTTVLDDGNSYWIVLRRSAAATLANYYIVEVDEDQHYPSGQVKTYDGTTWTVRSPAADMPFRVTSATGTLGQARSMIEANAEFGLGSVEVLDTSNIQTWQYREGDSLGRDEVEELIAIGIDDGRQLLADVLEGRKVFVYARPPAGEVPYAVERDGKVRYNSGAPIDPGEVIAGVWINVDWLPWADVFAAATGLFVANSEYDAASDSLNWETDGVLNAFRGLGRGRQG